MPGTLSIEPVCHLRRRSRRVAFWVEEKASADIGETGENEDAEGKNKI
jgi:hypothetical protein